MKKENLIKSFLDMVKKTLSNKKETQHNKGNVIMKKKELIQ